MRDGTPPRVYMAGRMVLRHGSGGDNKVPGQSYRPFDIMLRDGIPADSYVSSVEQRYLLGVRFLYTGPWQAVGSYHGLVHGITDYGTLDPRGIVSRAQHGIDLCDICFALLDGEDCYGTLAEIGYAKGIGKPVVVGVQGNIVGLRDKRGLPLHQMGSELWFAIEMADVRLYSGNVRGILFQFARLLAMVSGHRPISAASLHVLTGT